MCAGCGGCSLMSCSMGVQMALPLLPSCTADDRDRHQDPPPCPGRDGARAHPPRPRRKTHRWGGAAVGIIAAGIAAYNSTLVVTSVSKRPYGSRRLAKTKHGATGGLSSLPWAGGTRGVDDEAKCHGDGHGRKRSRHVEKRILLVRNKDGHHVEDG